MTGWLTRHPATLSEDERAGLKNVLAGRPELDTAAGHVRDFGEIMSDRLGSTLPAWINAVDTSQLNGLTGFALHLLRDLDAVTAGLTLHWSSGGTEGAVNRIKKDQKVALRTCRIQTTPQVESAPVTLCDRSPRSVTEPIS
ncbi:transposase [Streptomyces scabiei]|uniref:transposase n=1 Tax=Streptomyces scabiei TaxID=1930 RepID=UPI000ABE2BEB|nr:transposase [Streptomyces scabiei]